MLLLLPCFRVSAETILLMVTETRDGLPNRPPFSAREGIMAVLFDDGQIAFETPVDEPVPPRELLPAFGAATGADVVAAVVVDWHEERLPGGLARVSGRGSLVLLDVRSLTWSDEIPLALDNAGRERDVGRAQLGKEIGLLLVRAWQASRTGR